MDDTEIEKIIKFPIDRASRKTDRLIRHPKTLHLNDQLFKELQRHCNINQHAVNDLIEALIKEYLLLTKRSIIPRS